MEFTNERYEPFILRTKLLKETKYVYFLLLIGYSLWILTHYMAGVFDKALQDPFFWISIPLYIYVFSALRKIVKTFRNLLERYPKTSEIGATFTNTVEDFVYSKWIRLLEVTVPTLSVLLIVIYWQSKGWVGTLYGSSPSQWGIIGQICWLFFYIVILWSIFISFILVITGVVKGMQKLEENKSIIVKHLMQADKFSLRVLDQELKPISDFVLTVVKYATIYVIIWNVGIFYVNLKIIGTFDLVGYFFMGFSILFVSIIFLISRFLLSSIMSEAKEQLLTHYYRIYDNICEKYFEFINNNENIKQSFRGEDLKTIRDVIADLEKYSTSPFGWNVLYKFLLLNSSFIFPVIEISLRKIIKI